VQLRIQVLDLQRRALEQARVSLAEFSEPPAWSSVPWDDVVGRYVARELPSGQYLVRVEASEAVPLEPQTRTLLLSEETEEELFVLGEPGLPALYRGRVRVPFQPLPELLAVRRAPGAPAAEIDAYRDLLRALRIGAAEVKLPPAAASVGIDLLRLPPNDAPELGLVLERLARQPAVAGAGAVVLLGKETLSFLSDDVTVRFGRAVSQNDALEFAQRWDLKLLRRVPYARHTWQFQRRAGATYRLLDDLQSILLAGEVDWAEPDLVTPPPLDAIHPTDFLWPGQWDHHLVGCPEAWQALDDVGLPAFGDPKLIIAIIDQGIQSVGGIPTHEDFQGTVGDDDLPKVCRLFDFLRMVDGNDAPLGNHGMGAAGVAIANANNAVPGAGAAFGIAGAAPNARAMGLIYSLTDSDVADMYVWAAGFDPQSSKLGFPPLTEGASILSSSVGFGANLPLPGIASEMLQFVTTSGRAGKGCLCFFSAGNDSRDFTAYRPYAAHPKAFGITASTLNNDGLEVRANYSCWGLGARFCAPSDDRSPGGTEKHNPPTRYATYGADCQPGEGEVIAYPNFQAKLVAAAATSENTIQLDDTFGLAFNDRLMISDPGSLGQEPATIFAIDSATNTVTLRTDLMNSHAADTNVYRGPALHRWFGGTSSSTPLCAGIAALVLSANPELNWADVLNILASSAVKIDVGNTSTVGRWLNADGLPVLTSGGSPIWSQWYGFGRINAAAAVALALATRVP
jgi:subtilisin family serine protease